MCGVKLLGAHTYIRALVEFILVCGEDRQNSALHCVCNAYMLITICTTCMYVRVYAHDTTFVCSYLVLIVLFSMYAVTNKFAPSLEIQNNFPHISVAALRRGSEVVLHINPTASLSKC